MSPSTVLFPQWKSAAAAVPDSEAIESSFASMAYPIIQQKARALMKPGYVIGFEVVYKNSPDNNRLVGILACRVNKSLLYIPAFFVNGAIKGIDSIYEYTSKMFKPLNEGWVQYFLERNMDPIGRGVPKSLMQRAGTRVDMGAFGAGMFGKSASAKSAALLREEGFEVADDHIQQAWESIKQAAKENIQLRPILADFADKAFTDPNKGLDFLAKVASASTVANHIVATGALLQEFEKLANLKLASRKEASVNAPRVTIHTGLWDKSLGVDSGTYYRRGYHLKQAYAVKSASETLAYKEVPYSMGIESVGSPGVYEIQALDGKTDIALVVVDGEFRSGSPYCSNETSEPGRSRLTRLTALIPSKKICLRCGPSFLFGTKLADINSEKADELTSKTLPSGDGEIYVVDKSGRAARIWGVHSKKDVGGVTIVNGTFTINPDEDQTKLTSNIVGKDARFFQCGDGWTNVDAENAGYLCIENVANYLRNDRWKEIEVTAGKEEGESTKYRVKSDGKTSLAYLDPAKLACSLATLLDLDAETAMQVVDSARDKGRHAFLISPTKQAGTALRVIDEPVWQQDFDQSSGAEIVHPQSFNLRTEFAPHVTPTPLPGDRWDPEKYLNTIMEETPERLAQIANDTGAASLFDHGIVSSLTKSKDVGALADTYLEDLVAALDKLLRMKFLLSWSPEDFKEAYGTDDLIEKEIELQSVIESFGDIVLDVMRRVRDRRQGDPSLLASNS